MRVYDKALEILRIVKLQAEWIRLAKLYICILESEAKARKQP
jgi:hypothetical protein